MLAHDDGHLLFALLSAADHRRRLEVAQVSVVSTNIGFVHVPTLGSLHVAVLDIDLLLAIKLDLRFMLLFQLVFEELELAQLFQVLIRLTVTTG